MTSITNGLNNVCATMFYFTVAKMAQNNLGNYIWQTGSGNAVTGATIRLSSMPRGLGKVNKVQM